MATANELFPESMNLKGFPSIPTVEYHDRISSTNDRAKEILRFAHSSQLPCLVIASRQTSGRGRGGKTWWSGDGALMMSLGFERDATVLEDDGLSFLSLLVGLTMRETIRERLPKKGCSDERLEIHWPNDVYVDGKKLVGILIESTPRRNFVVGIGVNVNNSRSGAPEELRERITSLVDILHRKSGIPGLVVDFLFRFYRNLEIMASDRDSLRREVERYCFQLGKVVTARLGTETVRGRCVGIDRDGSLRVETDDGMKNIRTGLVETRDIAAEMT